MSASPAKVSTGSMKQITAETRNRPLNSAGTQRCSTGRVAKAMFWTAASRNMTPTSTPTVVTEALSNWRMTSEMTSQATPATSPTHQ